LERSRQWAIAFCCSSAACARDHAAARFSQRNGGQKKLVGNGTERNDAESAEHKLKLYTAKAKTMPKMMTKANRGKPGAQSRKVGFTMSFASITYCNRKPFVRAGTETQR
jgi:hypothetical protein